MQNLIGAGGMPHQASRFLNFIPFGDPFKPSVIVDKIPV